MKRFLGAFGAAAAVVSLFVAAPADAGTVAAGGTAASVKSTVAPHRFSMRDQYAREIVRYGQSDRGVYRIAHVRELQYRLRWAGRLRVGVSGYFGDATRIAVRRYQRGEGLHVTGVANHVTWAHLLRDTLRHRHALPAVCRRDGWHACYDRSMHQVVLLHNNRYVNTWLVRGGMSQHKTRLGTNAVYYRDIDHKSATYDGSPMPYSQFFDGGEALHGSGFMIDPFSGHSHGCVNMFIEDARQLWNITVSKRLVVTVYGAWS
ncbi:MAG: murein L,D-transpeptidase [Nocardioidaceae bacterium]|nr:murein L,D-transpeptidase [Nocardioidaceae bacterium]